MPRLNIGHTLLLFLLALMFAVTTCGKSLRKDPSHEQIEQAVYKYFSTKAANWDYQMQLEHFARFLNQSQRRDIDAQYQAYNESIKIYYRTHNMQDLRTPKFDAKRTAANKVKVLEVGEPRTGPSGLHVQAKLYIEGSVFSKYNFATNGRCTLLKDDFGEWSVLEVLPEEVTR